MLLSLLKLRGIHMLSYTAIAFLIIFFAVLQAGLKRLSQFHRPYKIIQGK